ncbi:MAG: NADP-dependent malic enzyme [Ilumatobacteraceae bacterium]
MSPSRTTQNTTPRTRPSAGFALSLLVRQRDGIVRTIIDRAADLGGEVFSIEPESVDTRRIVIAASSAAHHDELQTALADLEGIELLEAHDATFALHEGGKLAIAARAEIRGPEDLAMAYTPGVGRVSTAIAENTDRVWTYTGRRNAVAVLSNGTAVLGLGDIGPEAAMPVMEGKAVLFKNFGGVDAYPVCVNGRTVEEMVAIGMAIAPTFGGINLEDIKAPECFEIEQRLQAALDIPVFHDDQHGTAIVALAALENAAKVVGKPLGELRVVIVGTGAAGVACAQLIHHVGVADVIGVDSTGILHQGREGLTPTKQWFVEHGNRDGRTGGVREALVGADVLFGLSGPGNIEPDWLAAMASDAIVFAMANPVPEIMPEQMPANVRVVATGRSDYPNQINNVLAFPGVFRGLLDVRATRCTIEMKLAAAAALASMVPEPTSTRIIPGAFEDGVTQAVADAVSMTAIEQGYVRN